MREGTDAAGFVRCTSKVLQCISQFICKGNKLLLSSGRTREAPFWLSDMFVIHLAEYGSMTREGVRWARLEPRAQKPYAKLPLARAQQASIYSPLCSVGHVREATRDPMPGALPPTPSMPAASGPFGR